MLYINSLTFHHQLEGGARYLRFAGGRFKPIYENHRGNIGVQKRCAQNVGTPFVYFLCN